MADTVSPATRSSMMSKIRSGNTAPEITLRKILFAKGLRYRLHRKDLPGKPDLVFSRFKAVIFVHGCFWHMHQGACYLYKRPSSNTEFWDEKLSKNRARDALVKEKLIAMGWRVCTVWECSVRSTRKDALDHLANMIHSWLLSENQEFETEAVKRGGR